jgi:hypothetical protein
MSGQERLNDRLKNKFKHLLHSLVPSRIRSPSPLPSPARDPQASESSTDSTDSTLVGSDSNPIHGIPDTQPSIVIDLVEDDASRPMADLSGPGFQGVKTTLQLVERATDVFPTLKSTATGLLGVIYIMEVRDFQLSVVFVIVLTIPQNQQDRQDLEQKLTAVVSVINNHHSASFHHTSRGSFGVNPCQFYLGNAD